MATVNPLLQTKALSCAFGGLQAVDSVDFVLPEGEIRAIIGPNGAGKTTFVSLICGRIRQDSGQIFFGGRDISRFPAHRRVKAGIAYTFQITSIFPSLSVLENVQLAAHMHSPAKPAQSAAMIAAQTIENIGLSPYISSKAGTLSYGHQRLLEVAMGMALHPRLLILDEPTQGLSDGEIERFIDLIRAIAKTTTVLLIEHNMDVVMALAQRITVMEQGRILAEGTPEEIRADKNVQRTYMGLPDAEAIS